jgi:hypothetical protein
MTPAPASRPAARPKGILGPAVVLSVLGIVSGLMAVYLTLRVPSEPVPDEVAERAAAIDEALGEPGAAEPAPITPPQLESDSPLPGRPREVGGASGGATAAD